MRFKRIADLSEGAASKSKMRSGSQTRSKLFALRSPAPKNSKNMPGGTGEYPKLGNFEFMGPLENDISVNAQNLLIVIFQFGGIPVKLGIPTKMSLEHASRSVVSLWSIVQKNTLLPKFS